MLSVSQQFIDRTKKIANLPISELDTSIRTVDENDGTYVSYMKKNINITFEQEKGMLILVLDSLNIFRSSAKCLCDRNMEDIFELGVHSDFKSYCLFLAVYIPAIITDFFQNEREENNGNQILMLDIVTKPSNWLREYTDTPCNHINVGSEHIDVKKQEDEGFLNVSCNTNYLACVKDTIKSFVDNYQYIQGEIKPFVRFSVAIQKQNVLVTSPDGETDQIRSKKVSDLRGLDDLLAIKKVFKYREAFPECSVRLITSDTQRSNVIDEIKFKSDGNYSISPVSPIERLEGNGHLSHTVELPVKSPVVDITEVFVDIHENISHNITHQAGKFWKEIGNKSISNVIFSPHSQWGSVSDDGFPIEINHRIRLMECMWNEQTVSTPKDRVISGPVKKRRDILIRRKNPISKNKCNNVVECNYFRSNQIVLSLDQASSFQGVQEEDGIIDLTFTDNTNFASYNRCIENFISPCEDIYMNDFNNILNTYISSP